MDKVLHQYIDKLTNQLKTDKLGLTNQKELTNALDTCENIISRIKFLKILRYCIG